MEMMNKLKILKTTVEERNAHLPRGLRNSLTVKTSPLPSDSIIIALGLGLGLVLGLGVIIIIAYKSVMYFNKIGK